MNLDELISYRKRSPLILAIDVDPVINIEELLEGSKRYVAGVKIGLPYILLKGISEIKEIISVFRDDYFFIADIKLADIGFIGELMIKLVKEMSFNAFISHGFIGMRGALEKIISKARELDLFLFVVAAMSHPGAEEIFNRNTEKIVKSAYEGGVQGFVAPATLPGYIRIVRSIAKNSIIISPGVGAQGAEVGSAISNGSDFEIIGRRITLSEAPVEEIQKVFSIYREKKMI